MASIVALAAVFTQGDSGAHCGAMHRRASSRTSVAFVHRSCAFDQVRGAASARVWDVYICAWLMEHMRKPGTAAFLISHPLSCRPLRASCRVIVDLLTDSIAGLGVPRRIRGPPVCSLRSVFLRAHQAMSAGSCVRTKVHLHARSTAQRQRGADTHLNRALQQPEMCGTSRTDRHLPRFGPPRVLCPTPLLTTYR